MANNSPNKSWLRRTAALGEVLGVLLLGNVMARLISNLIGLAGSKQQLNAVPEGVDPDFLKMA